MSARGLSLTLGLSLLVLGAPLSAQRAAVLRGPQRAGGPAAAVEVGAARIAAVGTAASDWWVKESDVAAGGGHVLVVFMQGAPVTAAPGMDDPVQVRYAFFDGRTWTEGLVDGVDAVAADPAVVHDGVNDRFVVTYFRTDGLVTQQNTGRPVYARIFDLRTRGFLRDRPTLALPDPGQGNFYDKPWIVTGHRSEGCQELVVTAFLVEGMTTPRLGYGRSFDGGLSWTHSDPVDAAGAAMATIFCPQPAIPDSLPGAPLYVVTRMGQRWVFWSNDDPCGATPATARFDLLGVFVNPVALSEFINTKVPGTGKMVRVPYLVADPSSRDRLFLLYTDVRPGSRPSGSDMDVLCVRLQRDPMTGTWSKSAPVRVNDNPLADDTDQFTPAAVADGHGRLHVLFYDGRRYAGGAASETCPGPGAKYDATYAISEDHGETFRNFRIPTATGEPVLCEDVDAAPMPPGEYPGIAVADGEVWAAFAGTSHTDESQDQSVIWATRVHLR